MNDKEHIQSSHKETDTFPETQVETTSVFRSDLLKEMDATAGDAHADAPSAANIMDTLPVGTALLVVKRGPNSGSRFLLDQDVTVAGRHPKSDILLDDSTVSRRHAEFRRTTDGQYEVVDVGSLNGTYVNKESRISAVLNIGDEIQIGKFRLLFFPSSQA